MGWVKRIIGETSENRIIGRKKSIIHQGLAVASIAMWLSLFGQENPGTIPRPNLLYLLFIVVSLIALSRMMESRKFAC